MSKERYNVIITPEAYHDLTEINDYISYALQAPETADRYVDRIEHATMSLEFMPTKYSLVGFEPWHTLGVRHFPAENFIVYYYVREEHFSVYVISVIYTKRDQQKVLNDRFSI